MTKEEFYQKIDEWIKQPKENWNHITLVAYFYHKYFKRNGIHFTPARWSGNPASSKECRDMAKIFEIFAVEGYKELPPSEKKIERERVINKIYNYINWMFDYKYRYGNKGVGVTTQFFLSPYSLNEFQIMYDRALKKQSSKSKIEELILWCKAEIPDVLEIHQIEKADDLKLITQYADMYKLSDASNERRLLNKAAKMGII